MKRLIIFSAFILLLLPIVSSIGEGDTISQQQLNLWNADTVPLQCRQGNFSYIFGEPQFNKQLSCLDITPNEDGTYLIIRNWWTQSYHISRWRFCRLFNDKPYCRMQVITEWLQEFQNMKLGIRERIKQYQGNADVESNDFDFPDGDLN